MAARPTSSSETEDFATLFAESERTRRTKGRPTRHSVGDRVEGKLISVGREVAVVELPDGGEGTLDAAELRNDKGELTAAVGDAIEARIVGKGEKEGVLMLRRAPARGNEARASLGQFAANGLPVEGVVTGVNKGGLEVSVAGLRAFCPISQIELRPVPDATAYVGQKLLFRITKFDEEDRRGTNVVLSRRALLEEENRARATQTRAKLVAGAVLSGVVTALKDFGAFVDLGGIEGLLPASEIGYQRGTRPADLLSVGQPVTVQVLRIETRDAVKRAGAGSGPSEQITLSLKALEPDPWDAAVEQVRSGATVTGKVIRTETFGAFVEVAPGVEGLLHVSALGGGKPLRHAREAVKVGDTLAVTVLSVDREKRRISLGLGNDEERVDEEGQAAAKRAGGSSGMGTLGDLLRDKLRGPRS